MKQEQGRLRATAEREEIERVHPENVYEMVCVLHKRVCGFNKQGACLNPDVGEFVKQRKFIQVGTLRHQQSILSKNDGETHLHLTSAEDCQKHDPSDKNMCGTQDASHIGQLGCANRICGVRKFSKKQTQRRIILQSKSRCENDNAV